MGNRENRNDYTTLNYDLKEVVEFLATAQPNEKGSTGLCAPENTRDIEREFKPTSIAGLYFGVQTGLYYRKNKNGEFELKFAPNGGKILSHNSANASYCAQISSNLGGYIISTYSENNVLIEEKIFDKNRNLSFRRQNTLTSDGQILKEEDFYGTSIVPTWTTEFTYDNHGNLLKTQTVNSDKNQPKISQSLFNNGKIVAEIYNDRVEKFSYLSTYSYTPKGKIHMIVEKQIYPDKRLNRQTIYKLNYKQSVYLSALCINRHGARSALNFNYNTKNELTDVKITENGKVTALINIHYKERNGEKFAIMDNCGYVQTVMINRILEQLTDPCPSVDFAGNYYKY